MDFATFSPRRTAEIGARCHLHHPDDPEELFYCDGKPVYIDLLGTESIKGREASAKLAQALDARTKKDRRIKDMSVESIMRMAEKSEADRAVFFADITMGWGNITFVPDDKIGKEEAKPLPFSHENAVMLYKARPWIMGVIDAFLGDLKRWDENLIAGSTSQPDN